MTASVIEVRTGNEKHSRPDEHIQFPELHPQEFLLIERGSCAQPGANASWWLDTSPQNRANRMEAARICKEECPVFAECREVTDHVERSTHSNSRGDFVPGKRIAGIRAGEGPETRTARRRERKEQ